MTELASTTLEGFDRDLRRPRPETVMSDAELARIEAPTLFCLGRDDPFLSPQQARPAVERIPGAILHDVVGGHAPWFEDPAGCAKLVADHP